MVSFPSVLNLFFTFFTVGPSIFPASVRLLAFCVLVYFRSEIKVLRASLGSSALEALVWDLPHSYMLRIFSRFSCYQDVSQRHNIAWIMCQGKSSTLDFFLSQSSMTKAGTARAKRYFQTEGLRSAVKGLGNLVFVNETISSHVRAYEP